MVKIIQWNVLYKEKTENIVEFLKKVNADIICLQELTQNSSRNDNIDIPKAIAEELGFNYHFVPAQSYSDDMVQGNGIFSRYPIIGKNQIIVQDSKGEEVEAWDEGRVIVEADIDVQGKILKVATVHLSYTHKFQGTEQKLEEVEKLISYIKKQSNNFIITGDFNVQPESQTIRKISKYLKHCGPPYEELTWTTKPFEYAGFKETELRWRLDYAFCTSDVKVNSAKIEKTEFSDHLPIIIDLEL